MASLANKTVVKTSFCTVATLRNFILPNSGQLPLEEEMVGLIIEAPLADGQRGPSVLHLNT